MSEAKQKVNRLIDGFRVTPLVAASVRLGIFASLTAVPQLSEELAVELKLDAGALARQD
jgi:hypothetical protein